MSQEVLIDVYLVSDIDAWKIIFVTGKRNYAKVFHKQDKLQDVQSKLLEIVEKIEHSLPDPRSPTLRAPDNQAIELLQQVRDSFTKKGKLPPAELVLHTVNEALKALGRG